MAISITVAAAFSAAARATALAGEFTTASLAKKSGHGTLLLISDAHRVADSISPVVVFDLRSFMSAFDFDYGREHTEIFFLTRGIFRKSFFISESRWPAVPDPVSTLSRADQLYAWRMVGRISKTPGHRFPRNCFLRFCCQGPMLQLSLAGSYSEKVSGPEGGTF